MTTEKDKFLFVATPKQWDCWLSYYADNCADSPGSDFYDDFQEGFCLFCRAFRGHCWECMGVVSDRSTSFSLPCLEIPQDQAVDRAIARLEKTGIWGDE